MSKKKKMQEKAEAERRAAMQRRREDDYGYGYGPNSPFTPIIQLPPIVQPIIMMPIGTQMPNSPVRNDDDFDDFDDFDDDLF